jgi:hypothetical protein
MHGLAGMLRARRESALDRSGDGRGLLWWSYEYNFPEGVALGLEAGADPELTDASGALAMRGCRRPMATRNALDFALTLARARRQEAQPDVAGRLAGPRGL